MNRIVNDEKNKLHQLIWEMSKSDKAYLKKYSKIFIASGETKHKIFYSVLNKMEVFSLEILKEKLEKHGGYRRFKNTEQELYSQILEDLVILKAKKRPTWNYLLEHMKSGYLFLDNKFEEGLKHYDVLYKIKEETKNVTIDYMYYKYYYYSLNIMSVSKKINEIEEIKNVESELRKSIEILNLEFLLEAAIHNFDIYRFTSFNKSKAEFLNNLAPYQKKYVDVLPKQLETDKWKMLSIYYYFFCHYYKITQNLEQFGVYTEKFYQVFNVKEVKSKFYHEYLNAVTLRIEYLVATQNTDAYQVLHDFKKYIKESSFLEPRAFFLLMVEHLSLLTYYKLDNNIELENFLNKHKNINSATHRFALDTDLIWAFSFFKLGKLKEVQPYLDKIFKTLGSITAVYNNVLVSARVLDILIHFELKNYENIKYYIDNLEKEMKRNEQLLAFDKEFLNHLRKLSQQLFAKQTLKKDDFIAFLKNKKEEDRINSYLEYIDMEAWVTELKD